MSSLHLELKCGFRTAEQLLDEIAAAEDYKGTILFGKVYEKIKEGASCLTMLFHQYEFRTTYRLQADAVVVLIEKSAEVSLLHVISYEGKGILKKWFDFSDYMHTVFEDYIMNQHS